VRQRSCVHVQSARFFSHGESSSASPAVLRDDVVTFGVLAASKAGPRWLLRGARPYAVTIV
jgi:hypothetical protein